jgi:hypothetical protein
MKKQIIFLFCLMFQLTIMASPFKKTIQAFQEQTSKNSITEENWLKSIQETDDTTLQDDLNAHYKSMLGAMELTGTLYKLAYKKTKEGTPETKRLKAAITAVVLNNVWESTTFTSTAPSVSIALNAEEVLTKTVPKNHQTFLKYFYHVDSYTTRVRCPLNAHVPDHLLHKALSLIIEKINKYPTATINTVGFWAKKEEDLSPLLIIRSNI